MRSGELTTSDSDLLAAFIAQHDERAFAQIVSRHGSMVLHTARSLLKREQDAEDAFQAVFLALAQGAATIRHREALTSWLHQAAERAAHSVVRTNWRWKRKIDRMQKSMPPMVSYSCERDDDGLLETILRELHCLPRKYRVVIILCDIEGRTRQQAAAQLGMSAQTVTTQLARGRKLLKRRLTRIGVTVSMFACMQNLADAAADVDAALMERTINHSIQFVTGQTSTETGISSTVVQLAKRVLRGMAIAKYGLIAIVVCALMLSVGSLAALNGRYSATTDSQIIFYSDFADGSDEAWIHYDNTAAPWAPGVFDASSGGYVLATSASVAGQPGGISDSLFAVLKASSNRQFSNGVLRTRVQADTPGTRFMLVLRQTGGNGYAFSGGPAANTFSISRVDNASTVVLERFHSPFPPIAVGEAWILEAGAIGDRLFMTFWREGDPKPDRPQLCANDSNYSQGKVGIGIRKDAEFRQAGLLHATFDEVTFRTSESVALLDDTMSKCQPQSLHRTLTP